MTKKLIQEIVTKYMIEAKKEFGSLLKAVILYGSCARGDFDSESDIDIMILLDINPDEIPLARKRMRPIANQLDLEYDCVISATFQSYSTFEYYKEASAFYHNIESEGIILG